MEPFQDEQHHLNIKNMYNNMLNIAKMFMENHLPVSDLQILQILRSNWEFRSISATKAPFQASDTHQQRTWRGVCSACPGPKTVKQYHEIPSNSNISTGILMGRSKITCSNPQKDIHSDFSILDSGDFLKWGYQIIHFHRIFHNHPAFLGY